YTDTLGDLTFDLVGALIAAGVTFYAARRRPFAKMVAPGGGSPAARELDQLDAVARIPTKVD
ncbi:MAG TPA: hypothetical protein VK926_01525, partial [Gaiellaceae bacterium]|nr:hypothetical protein [Gaiellaceae bacterium]